MKKYVLPVFMVLGIFASVLGVTPARAAIIFNDPGFANTWNRVDKPVEELPGLGRGHTWGPLIQGSEGIKTEPYNGTSRTVQYFDKARMEVNDPSGDPTNRYYVTTGLLVKELVTGQRQDGDNTFTSLPPSLTQIAGDPNDYGYVNRVAPTYASFKAVATSVGNENGFDPLIGWAVGSYTNLGDYAAAPVETRLNADWDPITRHNVPDVFIDYGKQTGLIWNGSQYVPGPVFYDDNSLYVRGRPITEAYWIKAVVGGTEKPVMVQLFERRVLTYTPSNPEGFKVEMGNVGQHYYKWRYLINREIPAVPTKVELINEFGQDKIGLKSPRYIAVDKEENSFVADDNSQIRKYDKTGILQQQFGGKGSGDGQFDALHALAIDSQSNLYAVDITGQRIQKFDNQGRFLLKWGSQGNGNGQFNIPTGVATDGQSNVYVLDYGRVQKFNSQGIFKSSWGSQGSSDDQLYAPLQLALDSQGNFFILDLDSSNTNPKVIKGLIKKFDSQGRFLWKFGVGDFPLPTLAVDNQDNILWGLLRLDNNGNRLGFVPIASPLSPGEGLVIYQVTTDTQGHIYIVDGNNFRIYKLDSQGNILLNLSTYGRGDGQMHAPSSVAIDSQGNMFVFDAGNSRVQKFNSEGQFLLKWGSYGSGDGQFKEAGGLGVDDLGNVYVADAKNHRVQKFDNQGRFLFQWGIRPITSANCQGTLEYPNSVAIDREGNVYVLDGQISCIEKFDSQGHFILLWGGLGGSGNIAVDREGHLYFANSDQYRIQKSDLFGNFTLKWGGYGTGIGQFVSLRALTVDSQGNLYVINEKNIQKFDGEGHFLFQWPSQSKSTDQGYWANGLAVDGQGNVYFADAFGDHILKFRQS